MAWGDHERSERRIDEQMRQAQGYLTQQQQNIANQQGAYGNVMWGQGGAPQVGNTYGYGSTVPHWSQQGAYFQGNGTDTPSPMAGYSGQQGQGQQGQVQGQDPRKAIEAILRRYPPSSQGLEQAMPEIQAAFPGTRFDTSGGPRDEIVIPGYGGVDVLANAETGGTKSWTWQHGGGGGGGIGGGGVVGQNLADYGNIMGRYENFADTGGYSDQDLANIRSRALSPIRSIYSTAQQKMEQQRALQGGYSPGFATAMSRFSREQGQLSSDAATNAEAAIAEMRQRGQLAGMGGMASMYGATPGLSNMFGQQALQSQAQGLQAGQLQNQLSLGLINSQNQLGANVRGNLDSAINTGLGASQIVGNIGNAIDAWPDDGGWGPGGMNPGRGYDSPGEVWGDGIEGTPNVGHGYGDMEGFQANTTNYQPGSVIGGSSPLTNYSSGSPGRLVNNGGYSPTFEGNTYNSSQNDPYRNQPYYGSNVPGYTPTAGNW